MLGNIKRWTGTKWEENPTRVGTAFTPPRPWKFWDGTTWRQAGEPPAPVPVIAPTYRSSNKLVYASDRTNSDVPRPSGVQKDDFLLMGFFCAGVFGTFPALPTLPSNWTWIFGTDIQPTDGSFRGSFNVARKIATASEPPYYSMSHSNYSTCAAVAAYSGVDIANPFAGTPSSITDNTFASIVRTVPGMTTTQDNSMLVEIAFDWADNTTNEIAPPGMTERQDFVLLSLFDQVIATAGPTGSRANDCNSIGGNPRGGCLIALKGI